MGNALFGKIIKNRRKELGITQPNLAELAGISINTLYKFERGDGNPTLAIITKTLDVLGLGIKIVVKDRNN